ncbi:universal stress protein [Halalkaliarchaeum desulfuricum]|nr:universal stress protein [Halalkaliarchaeum desulfuricum]
MGRLSEGGTLLVPISNPDTRDRLMDTAIDIARERSMRIVVLHVVDVPPQIPLSQGSAVLSEDDAERQLLSSATEQARDAGVEVDTRLRYARDVATGIVGAVEEYDADGLLAGWHGRPRRRDIVLGSFLDRLLAEAPCDLFVKRIRAPSAEIESILVPAAGGPHGDLAVELAGAIAAQHGATVHLLHVRSPDSSEPDREGTEALFSEYESLLEPFGVEVTTQTVEHDHVAGAITDETQHHELTVLGASQEPFLKRKLVGSVAEGVGRAAENSVIMVRGGPEEKD